MQKLKNLFRNKKFLVGLSIVLLILVVIGLFLVFGGPKGVVRPKPPVVATAPELTLIKIDPSAGPRETFDPYSQTFFEFSADLNQQSAKVTVSPYIPVAVSVYQEEKRVLVVEPTQKWVDGVDYSIVIELGLHGVGGETLKNSINYSFSITQPAVFNGGDPLPVPSRKP